MEEDLVAAHTCDADDTLPRGMFLATCLAAVHSPSLFWFSSAALVGGRPAMCEFALFAVFRFLTMRGRLIF